MAEINSVVIIGRLTKDPELKYTQGGMAILKGSVAVNRRKKSGEQWIDEANFFNFDYIGKGAESVAKYLKKGGQVGIQGELRQDRWEQDGQQRSSVGIHVLSLQLLGGKKEGQSESGQSDSQEFEDDVPF